MSEACWWHTAVPLYPIIKFKESSEHPEPAQLILQDRGVVGPLVDRVSISCGVPFVNYSCIHSWMGRIWPQLLTFRLDYYKALRKGLLLKTFQKFQQVKHLAAVLVWLKRKYYANYLRMTAVINVLPGPIWSADFDLKDLNGLGPECLKGCLLLLDFAWILKLTLDGRSQVILALVALLPQSLQKCEHLFILKSF